MEGNQWLSYKMEIREKIRSFSLLIIKLSEKLEKNTATRVINYQLTKSGTSVYANYRAALRARSKAEFFSKLSICVEEADETEMWLELLIASELVTGEEEKAIHKESLEILKILASMRKKMN